jgi:AAA15 family ATPase/GTPase
MESRGTIKMLDFLLPFMKVFEEGGVLVLDEFDASIHPEMIKGILAVFTNQELNKTGAQLIFTTHNPIFLNNQVFRRDQIFFIEKDEDNHDSTLYTLADFGSGLVRNDHNYMINYFKGRYGALPFLDFAGIVREWSGSQDE